MNNLNFRAWHKELKEMEKVLLMCFVNEYVELLPFRNLEGGSQEAWFFKDIVLMQSTGLKDSKGVEIFFDDLVEFRGRIYHVELDEDYAQPCLSEPYDALSFGDNREDCTVVGNLYENPELLPIDEDEQPELLGGGV